MEIKLFDLKNEMIESGEVVIDFLSNNFDVNYYDFQLQINAVVLVKEHHLCRLDLISYEIYGVEDYAGGLQKFNQICNPFSMEINDIIVCPSIASMERFYQREAMANKQLINDTKALFIDPSRASQKDQARLEQLKKIAEKRKNGSKEILPTNRLKTGEVPFKTDGTMITYSPSNSKPLPDLNALTQMPKPSKL